MSSCAGGWRPPHCDSRTGAAHSRRGVPCQDASGVWGFQDAGRQAVQLLVVSDGHGGSRYDRSDVGSRLACEVALQQARELFASPGARDATPEDWRQWLAVELPQRIVEGWRQRVLAHARSHPRADGAAASTLPYGATLGLLLLTPRWWGFTGLGDWDLVRLDAAGRGELVSEEPDTGAGAEATFSLCMQSAERYFAPRSGLHPLASDAQPFSLLLSSDGIRKSCGSDADFLTLAHYLCGLDPTVRHQPMSELALALDHISSQGSGDDVSVAIGRWGAPSDSEQREARQGEGWPLIVQPQLAQVPETPVASAAASPQVQEPHPEPAPEGRPSPWLAGAVAAVLLVAAGVAAAFWQGLGPFSRQAPASETHPQLLAADQLALLRLQAQQLCAGDPGPLSDRSAETGSVAPAGVSSSPGVVPSSPAAVPAGSAAAPGAPGATSGSVVANAPEVSLNAQRLARITASLRQRKGLFRDLALQAGRLAAPLPADLGQDPLAGLIAWSAWPHAQSPPPFPVCPELREALRQQWQAAQAADPGREQR